ncbi:MAG: MOSC domain-containing protein [Flavobacteriales bacterium]|nr:MOSC domain-containing protein [Flavobacteriales bacterium]
MSLTLASIHIYPIKSLGGFSVQQARLTDRGLEHDRRWMLVDEEGRFITQRECPAMACLHCEEQEDGFGVVDLRSGDLLLLPWSFNSSAWATVEVWDDRLRLCLTRHEWSVWFSKRLDRELNLVYMPDSAARPIDSRYAEGLTSLSDGYPYLIVSKASLDDLNARLPEPVDMERFRPNLVIAGGAAFQEDNWKELAIGSTRFQLVKPCARCVITTTDQRTGERGKEPLRTLASYRSTGNKVLFGMNAVARGGDVLRVGDLVAP